MLEKTRRSILVFSRLLQKRRKYLSCLSGIGLSVDLCSDEAMAVETVHYSKSMMLVDLETSEWKMSTWLENLQDGDDHSEVVFVTSTELTETIEQFNDPEKETGSHVSYYCANEQVLFQNAGTEMQRVLELFSTVI